MTDTAYDIEKSNTRFMLEFGRDLHEAGTPAHHLEEAMGALARRLGLEAQIFSTPTSIFIALGPVGEQAAHMLRVEPGAPDLERLRLVDRVIRSVAAGTLNPAAGIFALESIPSPSPRWGLAPTLLAFVLASSAAGVFFGGSLGDVIASAVLGLLVGVVTVVTARVRGGERLGDAASAAACAIAGLLLERYVAPPLVDAGFGWAAVDAFRVTLSGLIVLVPGLTLTLAMSELANRQLVSGTGRLVHAAMLLLAIGFGIAVGRSVEILLPEVAVPPAALPAWALFPALAAAPLAFGVLFRARPADLPVIYTACLLGFLGARAGAAGLGPAVGASAGALVVGLVANTYSRLAAAPAAIAAIPGIMLLVPGSIGYRSVEALLGDDAAAGVQGVFATLLVASSLAVGLLLANVALPAAPTASDGRSRAPGRRRFRWSGPAKRER